MAAYGDWLGLADHAVEHLDGEGDLTSLTGKGACAELGPDQMFIPADRGLGQVAPTVTSRTLPAETAALGHELDMPIARALPIRVGCARHCGGAGWDDHVRRATGLPGGSSLINRLAVVGAVRGPAGDDAL